MPELARYERLLSRAQVSGLLSTGLDKLYAKWRPEARAIRQKQQDHAFT